MVLVDSAVSSAAIDTTAGDGDGDGDGELQHLTLFEWETKHLPLSEALARRLGQTKWVSVQPDVEPGWWRVSAQQWVGAFTVGDLRIIVRPKIKPENLFVLLEIGLPFGSVALGSVRLREHERASASAGFLLRSDRGNDARPWTLPPLPTRRRRSARVAWPYRLCAAVSAGRCSSSCGVRVGRLHGRRG